MAGKQAKAGKTRDKKRNKTQAKKVTKPAWATEPDQEPKPQAAQAPAAVAEPKPAFQGQARPQPGTPPAGDLPPHERMGQDPVPKTTTSGMDHVLAMREKMIAALCPTCKRYANEERWTTADVEEQACDLCYRKLLKAGLL